MDRHWNNPWLLLYYIILLLLLLLLLNDNCTNNWPVNAHVIFKLPFVLATHRVGHRGLTSCCLRNVLFVVCRNTGASSCRAEWVSFTDVVLSNICII